MLGNKPKQKYSTRRQSPNPKTPRVPLIVKDAIDEWLDYLLASATSTAARLMRTRHYRSSSAVRRMTRHWKSVAAGLKWAQKVNRQRRASDE